MSIGYLGLGIWFLSIPVWAVVAAWGALKRKKKEGNHEGLVDDARKSIQLGLLMEAIVLFVIWCVCVGLGVAR